ncbi:mandelate racemase/muconate lactonizing enzyme family protein [Tessaracoccus sp. MC1756]|uniref:mandelate racemase/muconate lactonizing enzyme family protein n=1 Tax=Tessaracoccus sp. MC1756 TaxID=2760311 RepID=UPI001603F73E|nr:mandelate racemase/muconate lactonizing enzyme family protein [Tessaracoccus sp. MC1756]MBB1510976.1 mandelate racemase/muconate lactonizing enzyme family protein [Tessaracoccus sp. MC1756]
MKENGMQEAIISGGRVLHHGPRRSLLLLTASVGDGEIEGVGEAILEGSADTVESILEQMILTAVGKTVWSAEELEMQMRAGSFYPPGMLGLSALSAMDQAIWDLKGKALGIPVWKMLGGSFHTRVPLYFHAQSGDAFPTSEQDARDRAVAAVASASEALNNGARMVKTCVFGPVQSLPTRRQLHLQVIFLQELQELIGPEVDLAVDVHGRYTYPGVLRLLEALAELPLAFVEEPLHPVDRLSYARVVERSPFPIAAGERLGELWEFRQALDDGITILQPDLAHCGGLTGGMRIGALARTAGAQVALHNPLGPVNLVASINLVASQSNFMIQETVDLGGSLLVEPLRLEDGTINVHEQLNAPGLGLVIDPRKLLGGGGSDWRTPVWRDEIGAVRPW